MSLARKQIGNAAFTHALPKAELHAHLTGSISRECLHALWLGKQTSSPDTELRDPLLAIRPEGVHHDIFSFFKLFDTYIYRLCNDEAAVRFCTVQVLKDFEDDGVRYLELRTTPRESTATSLTKDSYISAVLDTIAEHGRDVMSTYLILSVDRRNTAEQAMQVVRLAIKYKSRGVVGVDLCGNPLAGDVATFKDAFDLAKSHGLKITLHFAEMPQSSSEAELETLLAYDPDRLGHVINVPPKMEAEIERRRLGLELCLSCNVHAKMINGLCTFRLRWQCSLVNAAQDVVADARQTDDVGVFGSSLSNEYLLAAEHFGLGRKALVGLSRSSMLRAFGGPEEQRRFNELLNAFEEEALR